MVVTDGRFLSAGSSQQLHQDHEGVDRHRPNLWHEVRGLDVHLTQQTKKQGTSLTVKSLAVKSDENLTNLLFLIWLGFQIFTNSLKSFISAPVRLIDKRGLICDHRNIGLNLRRMFVYFVNICLLLRKYLLLISTSINFRNFKI